MVDRRHPTSPKATHMTGKPATPFDAPAATSSSDAARVGRVRSDAPRGQSLVEALQGLGATELGGRSFDIAAIELGERIRNGRLRVGMTQAELAARVGCKQADISKIENGKGRDGPTYRRLRSFSDVLGVELGIGDRTVGGDVEVVTKTKDCVVHAKAPYSQYAPLLSRGQWASLREYAFKRAPAADADGAWDFCTLVSLEPTTRATLRPFLPKSRAAVRPTGPPPTTITSYGAVSEVTSRGQAR